MMALSPVSPCTSSQSCTLNRFGFFRLIYISCRAFQNFTELSEMGLAISGSKVFSVQVALLAPIISLTLAAAIFGFYVLLFGLSTYFLCKNKQIVRRRLHLTWTTFLFLISTFGALINASSGIMDAVVMYTAVSTQDFTQFIKHSSSDRTQEIISGLTYSTLIAVNLVADAVLINRCYLVWGRKISVIVLPILAAFGVNSIGLMADIMTTQGQNDTSEANFQLFLTGINYRLTFYYANAVVNFVVTMLIAGRIWWVGRRTMRYSTYWGRIINDKYKAIFAISYIFHSPLSFSGLLRHFIRLECGVIYPISLVAHAAVEGNVDKISIPVNLTPTVIQLAGVVPTLILVTVFLGKSISEKLLDLQNIETTLQNNGLQALESVGSTTSEVDSNRNSNIVFSSLTGKRR
ncbi:hypothetical protein D9758_005827 [Tetrapyrgos nigripes]|uniref:Uncharacterized protein n=1 Tax=Tetrapyrgos nigripes TaxID=182062 RepID=A0A8H5G2Y2_9AGAR|nr:hypothetical protein D9758_005827 [Tetrapyrgos nigripes]